MSLSINTNKVTRVLLADGWHHVEKLTRGPWKGHSSFTLDAYEFVEGEDTTERDALLLHGGGRAGVCSTGYSFTRNGKRISGPLTAILAVQEG